MSIITFLLSTKLGHVVIGLLACIVVAAGMYGYGHHKGVKSMRSQVALAQEQAKVAQDANASNQSTIDSLKAANAAFAASAAAQEARSKGALESMTEQNEALKMHYNALQAKLARTVNENGAAHAWACVTIPPSVLAALGLHATAGGENENCSGERSSDPTNPEGIDAAGAGAETAHGH